MSEIKIAADSGGGSVSLKGPATTTGNAAIQLTLPDVATGGSVVTADSSGNITASNFSGRNLISNGEFLIAQRSTAAVTTSAGSNEGYQTVDRWRFYVVGTAAFTQQQVELTTDAAPDGFSRALKIDCTTADTSVAAGDYVNLQQNIEGFDWAHLNYGRSDAKTVTISFWVKATKTGTYTFGLRNEAANRSYVAEYTVNSTNTWEKKTITIAGDTSGTWTTDNGLGARCAFSLMNGTDGTAAANSWHAGNYWSTTNQVNGMDNTDNNFLITGVQLEVGPATEFEHRFYGDELLRCQRYYEGVIMGTGTAIFRTWTNQTNVTNVEYNYKVEKRASPTFSLEGNGTWHPGGDSGMSAYPSTSVCLFQRNDETGQYLTDSNGDLCCSFSSEL